MNKPLHKYNNCNHVDHGVFKECSYCVMQYKGRWYFDVKLENNKWLVLEEEENEGFNTSIEARAAAITFIQMYTGNDE